MTWSLRKRGANLCVQERCVLERCIPDFLWLMKALIDDSDVCSAGPCLRPGSNPYPKKLYSRLGSLSRTSAAPALPVPLRSILQRAYSVSKRRHRSTYRVKEVRRVSGLHEANVVSLEGTSYCLRVRYFCSLFSEARGNTVVDRAISWTSSELQLSPFPGAFLFSPLELRSPGDRNPSNLFLCIVVRVGAGRKAEQRCGGLRLRTSLRRGLAITAGPTIRRWGPSVQDHLVRPHSRQVGDCRL